MEGTGVISRKLRAAIASRERTTARRLDIFGRELRRALGADTDALIGNHTCIYTVGSAGRGELTLHSDLDLFVVRTGKAASNLDAALLQAAIVRASRRARFPDPSGDGEWLRMHTAERFLELLGFPEDDTENTFTARMLLLLESRAIVGREAYRRIVDRVVDRYWRDAAQHRQDYQPILLINDIVRYWRILLLNYEARNTRQDRRDTEASREASRRLRSYKLRFSRCLTCYSALTYLLALTYGAERPHVMRRQVREMVGLSPLQRLIWVSERAAAVEGVVGLAERLLREYMAFLAVSERGKKSLLDGFHRDEFRAERSLEKRDFGEAMFELVSLLGRGSSLMRWIVV
jgi:hypothetical protein